MDPRIAKTHTAVMEAATELLVEGGPDAMTVDAVVARSGVAKSTVYRHWATRDELVADVFNSCAPIIEDPDPALDGESALRALVAQLAESLSDERWRRLIPAMLLLKLQHTPMADLEDDLSHRQMEVAEALLRRCVDEGALDPSVLTDLDVSLTLLVGPLLMAGLFDTVKLTDGFSDQVVEQFLAANRPGSHSPS